MTDLDAIIGLAQQMHPQSKNRPTLSVEPTDDGKWRVFVGQKMGSTQLFVDAIGDTPNQAAAAAHDELVVMNERLAHRCRSALARWTRKAGKVLRLVDDDAS